MDNFVNFEATLKKLTNEVNKNKNATGHQISMLAQIQEKKNIVWMEGPRGWTAWVEDHAYILHYTFSLSIVSTYIFLAP